MGPVAGWAVVAAGGAVGALNGYLAVLTVAARRGGGTRPAVTGPDAAPHHIVVLVPAHDEEGSIGATVDSILTQDYPTDRFRVDVVADNCSDGTATEAEAHGATAHRRDDPTRPGKGPALRWLLDRVAGDGAVDGVVIVDADTSMRPGFLRAADAALSGEGSAWQAYYTVRDPELSPGTALRHAALVLRHLVRPLGRTALGGSCGLFGNGMLFRAELLQDREFSAHLTEDVELQLELLLDGQSVGFLPNAVVEAEMPVDLAGARTQNERWERGRQDLARRFVPQLVRRSLARHESHRWRYLDAALDLTVPPLSVLGAATGATAVAAVAVGPGASHTGRFGRALAVASLLGLAVHVLGGLRVARSPREVYLALLGAPRFVVWKVILWVRVLLRPDVVSWRRTGRNQVA